MGTYPWKTVPKYSLCTWEIMATFQDLRPIPMRSYSRKSEKKQSGIEMGGKAYTKVTLNTNKKAGALRLQSTRICIFEIMFQGLSRF